MNINLDVHSPAAKQAKAMASLYGLENHGLTTCARSTGTCDRRRSTRRRCSAPKGRSPPRAVRRRHRQAHRARGRRQVRGARADHRGARLVGRSTTGRSTRRASPRCTTGSAATCRGATSSSRTSRRRRPRAPAGGAGDHPEGLARLFARTMLAKNTTHDQADTTCPTSPSSAPRASRPIRWPTARGRRPSSSSTSARSWRSSAAPATRARSRSRSSPSSTTCCRSTA